MVDGGLVGGLGHGMGAGDVFGGGLERKDLSVDGGLVCGLDGGMGADGWTAGRQVKHGSTALSNRKAEPRHRHYLTIRRLLLEGSRTKHLR